MQPEFFSLLPDRFTVYLARHATPDRTRHDIPYHTPPGPDLTERGSLEAAELGAFLQEMGVKHLLSSPFARAMQTASIASSITGALHETTPDLGEWRLNEVDRLVHERMWRAFHAAAHLSARSGATAAAADGLPADMLPGADGRLGAGDLLAADGPAVVDSLAALETLPVALISHGAPLMILLRSLGLPSEMVERCRIYDSRNMVPMAGAWRTERSNGETRIQLVFVPQGARLPAGITLPDIRPTSPRVLET